MDNIRIFGYTDDGKPVYNVHLSGGNVQCDIITYGAAVRRLIVPDKNNIQHDVVLGFDDLKGYIEHEGHFGGTIGRFANRIADSRFTLNGVEYILPANDGPNHLHGGPKGFDRKLWDIISHTDGSVTMHLNSPDGEEGYPGNMDVCVTYEIIGDDDEYGIRISYEAVCDKDTLCNLTDHSYFNLNGQDSGTIEDHLITINADAFTPVVSGAIPTGDICPVAGTPMDLREPVRIGERISDSYEQLQLVGGYDHNYVVNRSDDDDLVSAACAFSQESGIRLSVRSDRPGIQFYAGNFIGRALTGKNEAVYSNRHGFCLETQTFPNAPNHPEFPSAVLRAGETYKTVTEYVFDILRTE